VAEWIIEPLDRSHDRTQFGCGNVALDRFLHALVGPYQRRRLGRTYVAVAEGERRVRGYYTLAAGAVAFDVLPRDVARRLPRHPLPVILLARLAVDASAQGRGLGGELLVDALERCLDLGDRLGVHAVEVEAIDEPAKAFYAKYGFVALEDDLHHLYLPLATVAAAFGRP
jgi:GNAT superfamily N-acetyltransferase